jgi:hypothetical protein
MKGNTNTETPDSFAYSFDEEYYRGEFPSIDIALEEAKADRPDADTVFIGKIVPICAEEILLHADHIVERAQESLYDRVGDMADSYLDDWFRNDKNKAAAPAITAEIHSAIITIFEKHGINLHPTCWSVVDVKTVSAAEVKAASASEAA